MIFRLSVLFLFCISLLSCAKDSGNSGGCTYTESGVVAPASEVATLQAWITTYHPAAIAHPSGFFYEITSPGTGTVTPSVCSNVRVIYEGRFTNGFKFDESITGANFVLGNLIVGWQKGIPLIKKGGSINLYIPPSLGYGSTASPTIPANSYLVFVIQLTDVQ